MQGPRYRVPFYSKLPKGLVWVQGPVRACV
uniref:Uncharacterized protein n=1 Tax=Anguilla anguilla TaxID=7936 RepID=A0A0E9P937_ANGAN